MKFLIGMILEIHTAAQSHVVTVDIVQDDGSLVVSYTDCDGQYTIWPDQCDDIDHIGGTGFGGHAA